MNLPQLMFHTTQLGGKILAETTQIDPYQSLEHQRTKQQEQKKQRYQQWQQGIDLLEHFLITNREAGEDFANEYIQNNDDIDEDHQFQALLLLHARACQTTHEILTLIKNGFTDGAYARWRNLYETAAIASLIADKDDAGERFLDYRIIEDYHRAQTHQDYAKNGKLPLQPLSEEEMQKLEDKRNKILDKYNDKFDDNGRGYGWARKYLNSPHVTAIAKEAGLRDLKPYYELTHKLIHSGATGATYSMGKPPSQGSYQDQDKEDLIRDYHEMAYPSQTGFTDTGQNTAISLAQITTVLLNLQPTPPELVKMQALQEMVDDIQRTFVEIQQQVER